MSRYSLNSGGDFTPHPEGTHEGRIVDFEDRGIMEETYQGVTRERHKGIIKIESTTAKMDDGQGFGLFIWVTLSAAPNANLTVIRNALAGKALTRAELENFNSDDLLNIPIKYMVVHYQGQNGDTRAKLGVQPNGQIALKATGPAPETVAKAVDDSFDTEPPAGFEDTPTPDDDAGLPFS